MPVRLGWVGPLGHAWLGAGASKGSSVSRDAEQEESAETVMMEDGWAGKRSAAIALAMRGNPFVCKTGSWPAGRTRRDKRSHHQIRTNKAGITA